MTISAVTMVSVTSTGTTRPKVFTTASTPPRDITVTMAQNTALPSIRARWLPVWLSIKVPAPEAITV